MTLETKHYTDGSSATGEAPLPNHSPGQQARAKLVARILTDNGLEVTPPDDRPLDDIERERWAICVEIATRLGLDCDYVNPEDCGFRCTLDCCKYTPTQTTDC